MSAHLARRPDRLLHRILDTPDLVRAIQQLPSSALGSLVARVGLEDAGELVSLATTEQLTHLFDDDVFDEEDLIDAARFVLWLEVLLEAGDAFAADRVAALPEDLTFAAFHQHAWVFDLDAIAVEVTGREDLGDVNDLLERARTEELLGHLLVARRGDGWDAVWQTLVSLAERHAPLLERLLDRLREATTSRVADDGLHEVLGADAMLAEDATAEREERRARRGFVSASDARAFLRLAREGGGDPDVRDAIAAAYFRRLSPRAPEGSPSAGPDLAALVDQAGLGPTRAPRLPAAGGAQDPGARFRSAMEQLATTEPELHEARMEELAFLANALSAGARMEERPRRAVEAAEAAVEACARAMARRSAAPEADVEVLRSRSLDLLFREDARGR